MRPMNRLKDDSQLPHNVEAMKPQLPITQGVGPTASRRRRRAGGLALAGLLAALAAAALAGPGESKPVPAATALARKPLAARVQNLAQVAEEKSAWGSLRWLMNSKLEPQSGVTLGIVELNVGQSNPLHVHPNSDEVIYVLSGKCEQRVGNETVLLKPGDALLVPAGVPHQAKVIGNEPMKAVVAYNTGERQFVPVKE